MIGERVVAEAREWLGTPFEWQCSTKGRGCDCMGLIAGVARNVGRESEASVARWDYGGVVPSRELIEGLGSAFDRTNDPQPGDLLLLKLAGKPQHLAIYTGNNRMIHTEVTGPEKAIEVRMGRIWWAALHSAWTWRVECR